MRAIFFLVFLGIVFAIALSIVSTNADTANKEAEAAIPLAQAEAFRIQQEAIIQSQRDSLLIFQDSQTFANDQAISLLTRYEIIRTGSELVKNVSYIIVAALCVAFIVWLFKPGSGGRKGRHNQVAEVVIQRVGQHSVKLIDLRGEEYFYDLRNTNQRQFIENLTGGPLD